MGLVAVKQFEMQVAAGLIGEALEKFTCEAEAKRAGHVLDFFGWGDAFLGKLIQTAPHEVRPPAEINDAARETFIHRHVGLAGKWIFRMKTGAVTPEAAFVAERASKCLAEGEAAVFDGVVRVHFQIAGAAEFQIHDGVFGEERQHVVKKRDAGSDSRFAAAIEIEVDGDTGFFGIPRDTGLPRFHAAIKAKRGEENKAIARSMGRGRRSVCSRRERRFEVVNVLLQDAGVG